MQRIRIKELNASIELLGGQCPVQAEGVIDGKKFYFRSRWNQWRLNVDAVDPVCNPEFSYSEPWGEGPGDAGYMPHDEAIVMIIRGLDAYRIWEGDNVQKGNSQVD